VVRASGGTGSHGGQRRAAHGQHQGADQLEPEAGDGLGLRVDERLARVVERSDLVHVGQVADQEDEQGDQAADRDGHRRHLPELLVPRRERDQQQHQGEDREDERRVAMLIPGADRLQSLAARRGEVEDVRELRGAEHRRGPGTGEHEQGLGARQSLHCSAWRPG